MKEEKIYQCECGKVFKSCQALCGHKANCQIHKDAKKRAEELLKQEREARRLPNGLFKCDNPDCTNEHDGSYGSGRFCSRHCQQSFCAKQVKGGAIKGRHQNHAKQRAPYGTWKCDRCNLIFETRAQLFEHNHQVHPIEKGSSWNKGLTKETDERVAKYCQTTRDRLDAGIIQPSMKGKHLSDERKKKTSASMKKFF